MWLSAFCAASAWATSELNIPKPTDPLVPAPLPPALEASAVNLEVRLTAEGLAAAVDEGFPQVAARENDWSEAVTLGFTALSSIAAAVGVAIAGATVGVTSGVSVATGVVKAILVMILTPVAAKFLRLRTPRSAMVFGGLAGDVGGQ